MNLGGISTVTNFVKIDISRSRAMAAPILAIAVSLIILATVIWPKFTQALQIRAANRELAIRRDTLSAKVQILQSLDKVALDQQLAVAEQLLPSDKAIFAFLRQIEAAAGASGVILSKVDVAPGAVSATSEIKTEGTASVRDDAKSIASSVQVKVSLTSDYQSLLNFTQRIFSLARVTGVNELSVSSSDSAGEGSSLRTSIVVNAYWRFLPGELGSIESPIIQLTDEQVSLIEKANLSIVSGPTGDGGSVPSVPTGRSDLFAPF